MEEFERLRRSQKEKKEKKEFFFCEGSNMAENVIE